MDLVGKRFGKLIVKGADDRKGYVVCECDCGKTASIRATSLTKKYQPTRSCGCLHTAVARAIGKKTIPKNMERQVKTNLRYHTNFQVIEAAIPPKHNTSGYKGISWDDRRHKWLTYINVHGKRIFLGRFASLDDAVDARKEAEEKYHKPLIDQKKTDLEVGKNDC